MQQFPIRRRLLRAATGGHETPQAAKFAGVFTGD
jgi:hypothetical protein